MVCVTSFTHMKKTTILLLPLTLSLLAVGCTRSDQKTTASNDPAAQSPNPDTPKAPAASEVAANASKSDPALTPQPLPPAADLALNPGASSPTSVAKSDNSQPVLARISEWRLKGDEIKAEFDSSGRIVRSKAPAAGEPTGPMDSVLTNQVKEKLEGDSDLSSQKISASADDGIVTLTGSASSLDQIGKAVAVSLDTPGVKQVVSTIKLESKQ